MRCRLIIDFGLSVMVFGKSIDKFKGVVVDLKCNKKLITYNPILNQFGVNQIFMIFREFAVFQHKFCSHVLTGVCCFPVLKIG